jgi:hypothetical protein
MLAFADMFDFLVYKLARLSGRGFSFAFVLACPGDRLFLWHHASPTGARGFGRQAPQVLPEAERRRSRGCQDAADGPAGGPWSGSRRVSPGPGFREPLQA